MATTEYKTNMKTGDIVRVKMEPNTFVEGVLIEHWPEHAGWLVDVSVDEDGDSESSTVGGFAYNEITLVKSITTS